MSKNPFVKTLAILLTITFVASSTFLIAPQKAHATLPVSNIPGITADALSLIEETINEIANVAAEIELYADWINTYILQPVAFIKSGNLMKSLTAGVIKFVTGVTNGTGASQFVQNLQGNLQTFGDKQASAFLSQFKSNSNSPFAASIVSSLRKNYLQSTSLAGFFSANKCTLTESSSDVNGFLAGDWSKGGITAWFALTTQDQNNPYMLYQKSQSRLNSLVGSAQAARSAQLSWGQGFLSWCGAADSESSGSESNDNVSCSTASDCTSGYCEYDDITGASTCKARNGVNPGDPCTNSDGTSGTIKTPGSVIKASLDKVLGGNQDKLVQVGRMAKELGGVMNSIATVWNTVNFAKSILGGSGSNDGLFGFGTSVMTSSSNSSAYDQASTTDVYTGVATDSALTSDMPSRIEKYKTAWDTIKASANTASTSVKSLIKTCTDNAAAAGASATFKTAATAQVSAAQTVLNGAIATVFADFETASTTIKTANATVANIKATLANGESASDDIQSLQTMSPTSSDLKTAMYDATVLSTATASPEGSLTVSGDSIADRMSLISTNAATLKTTVCDPSSSSYVTS